MQPEREYVRPLSQEPWRSVPEASPRAACNICGCARFERGPKGRTGPTGVPPRCVDCRSLERHRMYRDIYERMRAPWFGDARVLQFSEEPTLDPSWFRSFEVSVFGARNTLDLQAIDRPDGAYDIVMCNNVIEHVADDHSALRELDRVTSDTGFVFLAFPDPLEEARTRAWEYPDPNRFGHYRVYGPDVADRFADALEGRYIVFCQAGDPVTGTHDCAFLITRNGVLADGVLRLLPGSALLDLGDPDCLRALVPTVSRP